MTETSTHAAPVAAQFRHYLTGFGVATLGAVFLAVTGALGTGEAGFATRLVFWVVVMLAGAMIGLGVSITIKAWGKLANQRWLEIAVISILLALPQTLVVVAARSLFFDLLVPVNSGIAILFGFVLFITVIMVALEYAMHRDDRTDSAPLAPDHAPAVNSSVDPLDRFRERLPHGLRAARLLALEAEDHYLRVHTDCGSGLILLRLADAVAELEAVEGAQTHRSWWVARDAVVGAKRADGRATLTLAGGQDVPVSRSFYKAINDGGWLA